MVLLFLLCLLFSSFPHIKCYNHISPSTPNSPIDFLNQQYQFSLVSTSFLLLPSLQNKKQKMESDSLLATNHSIHSFLYLQSLHIQYAFKYLGLSFSPKLSISCLYGWIILPSNTPQNPCLLSLFLPHPTTITLTKSQIGLMHLSTFSQFLG